jgi:hypothetical protein
MGFGRTISEGSRDADRISAGGARLRFITRAAPWADLGLAILGWGGLAAFFSHLVQSPGRWPSACHWCSSLRKRKSELRDSRMITSVATRETDNQLGVP